jgi:transcription elongation factor GreA
MAEERFILTRSGYEALKRELAEQEDLYQQHLAEFADVNYSANDPMAEDAAYFDRRVTKEYTQERLNHLRLVLEHAEVIDEDPDPHTVDPGDRVTVWDFKARKTRQFDLLGSREVVFVRDGVSIDSPVGQALLGRRVGDVVEVTVPDGTSRYAVRKIERIPQQEAD